MARGVGVRGVMSGLPGHWLTVFGSVVYFLTPSRESVVLTGVRWNALQHGPDHRTVGRGVFNVGADVPFSVNEVARAVAQAIGGAAPSAPAGGAAEVVHAYSSHAKMQQHFDGLAAGLSLAEVGPWCGWAPGRVSTAPRRPGPSWAWG